jgi:hypothetical protein
VSWLKQHSRAAQAVFAAMFLFGLMLPLNEMIRLHPYQYTHFNHIAGTVRGADDRYMLDYWGLALKQASEGLRQEIEERHGVEACLRRGPAQYASTGTQCATGAQSPAHARR